jgi:hypothetical protein
MSSTSQLIVHFYQNVDLILKIIIKDSVESAKTFVLIVVLYKISREADR